VSDEATVVRPETGDSVQVAVAGGEVDQVPQPFQETWRFREIDREGRTLREEFAMRTMRWTHRHEAR